MALFGKLFEKKECAICGGEIGLLGNRKLEDGNCCKNCAAKLSPWFSDRRQSTVEEIKEQLAYRETNQEKVAAFRVTRTLGEGMKVLLDEDDGRFMVTSARNWQEADPDGRGTLTRARQKSSIRMRRGNGRAFPPDATPFLMISTL